MERFYLKTLDFFELLNRVAEVEFWYRLCLCVGMSWPLISNNQLSLLFRLCASAVDSQGCHMYFYTARGTILSAGTDFP